MKKLSAVIIAGILILGCGSPPSDSSRKSTTELPGSDAMSTRQEMSTDFLQQGIAHLKNAEVVEAIQSFDNAIRNNPLDPESYIVLAQTYIRLKNFPRAIDTLSAAERVAPQRGDISYLLALAHGLKGDQEQAQASARRSIDLFRQDKDEENFLKAVALLQGLLESK